MNFSFGNLIMFIGFNIIGYQAYIRVTNSIVEDPSTLSIVILFTVYLYFLLKQVSIIKKFRDLKLFDVLKSKEINPGLKTIYTFSMLITVVPYIVLTIIYTLTCLGYTSVDNFIYNYLGYNPSSDVNGFADLLIWLLAGALGIVIFSSVILSATFFGVASSGISVSVMLYELFNGMAINIDSIFETIFDFALPDMISFVIVVGQFILSIFITKDY